MPKTILTPETWEPGKILVATTLTIARAITKHAENFVLIVDGSGVYIWDPDNGGADNGTTILKPGDETGDGRWKRVAS